MRSYYDKVLEYLESGDHEDAVRYLEQWKVAGLLDQGEVEALTGKLPSWSRVVRQEALDRLLAEKERFTREEFLQRVESVDREMRAKIRWKPREEFWVKG